MCLAGRISFKKANFKLKIAFADRMLLPPALICGIAILISVCTCCHTKIFEPYPYRQYVIYGRTSTYLNVRQSYYDAVLPKK